MGSLTGIRYYGSQDEIPMPNSIITGSNLRRPPEQAPATTDEPQNAGDGQGDGQLPPRRPKRTRGKRRRGRK